MSIELKEIWGKLKYWQKGGLLLGLFGFICNIIIPPTLTYIGVTSLFPENTPFLFRLVIIFISSPMFLVSDFLNPFPLIIESELVVYMIWGILSFPSYFILGAAIGESYNEYTHGFRLFPGIISSLILIGYFLFSSFMVFISYLN